MKVICIITILTGAIMILYGCLNLRFEKCLITEIKQTKNLISNYDFNYGFLKLPSGEIIQAPVDIYVTTGDTIYYQINKMSEILAIIGVMIVMLGITIAY